jgi:hypothetical protein
VTGHQAARSFFKEHTPFDSLSIDDAPACPGVYLLYSGERLIYIGLAESGSTIRQCLQEHKKGSQSDCTSAATGFDYEVSASARRLYLSYLAIYREWSGGLSPACNEP